MPRVVIQYGETYGAIDYPKSGNAKGVVVDFPDADIRRKIQSFLRRERTFKLQRSGRIDDYREVREKPIKNVQFLELALCELYNTLDVFVHWRE